MKYKGNEKFANKVAEKLSLANSTVERWKRLDTIPKRLLSRLNKIQDKKTFVRGKDLLEIRKAAGLTQEELSSELTAWLQKKMNTETASISRAVLSYWETGQHAVNRIYRSEVIRYYETKLPAEQTSTDV